MTNLATLLQDFGALEAVPTQFTDRPADADLEAERLESFEQGYKAGWDDSVRAYSEDQNRVSSVLSQNLLDLGFTYNEAAAQISKSLVPLLQQISDVLLPEIARGSLSLHIVDQLQRITQQGIGGGVEIRVCNENQIATAKMLDQDFGVPVSVVADDSLGEGQAILGFADRELQIDVQEALSEVQALVAGFAHEAHKEVVNG